MKIYKNSEKIFKISLLLIGVAVIFSFGINSSSAVVTPSIYVSTHGNNNWDGQLATWNGTSGPKATIKNATGTIASGGTVHIASGTYKENNININKNMNVRGENQKNTIINGTNTGPIFNIISGVKITLINLTLTNGTASNGGVIYNLGTLNVIDSTFTNNKATNGGAIYNDHTLTVTGSTFTKNTASNCGGAIYNDYTGKNTGTLTVSGTKFTGNNANYGGAIGAISHFGTLTLTGTTFTNNNATWGGAIYNDNVLTVKSSTFTGNTAKSGGAIYNEGIANVHFSRIVKNIAKSQGNAIYNDFGTANVSLNWWGSNEDPRGFVYGSVNVTPWLVLTVTSNPNTIPNSYNSTITADFLHDSNGVLHDPYNGHIPDEILVTFNSTLGTMGTPTRMVNGVSHATLHAGTVSGQATVSAKLDNQTVKRLVTIKDTIPPTVKTIDPANNAVNVPANKVIKLTFSEPIKAGNMWIEIKNSSGKLITITKTISTNVLTINHSTPLTTGKYTLTLHTGSITDLAGNPLALKVSSFTVDNTPPKVSSTTPSNLKTGVSKTNNITIKFSEYIKTSTYFNNITIKNITTGKYLTLARTISGNTLNIKTSTKSANTWYIVTIPKAAIKDIAGNNLLATYTFKFKTGS